MTTVMRDLGSAAGQVGSIMFPIPGLDGKTIGSTIGGWFGFKDGVKRVPKPAGKKKTSTAKKRPSGKGSGKKGKGKSKK